jgi:hypothetical protein
MPQCPPNLRFAGEDDLETELGIRRAFASLAGLKFVDTTPEDREKIKALRSSDHPVAKELRESAGYLALFSAHSTNKACAAWLFSCPHFFLCEFSSLLFFSCWPREKLMLLYIKRNSENFACAHHYM